MAGSTHLTAIYSGFAIPMLFLAWVHFAWLIVLAGASLTYHRQHPERLGARREPRATPYDRQTYLLLAVASAIARRHHEEGIPWDAASLARALNQPVKDVREVLERLVAGGFLFAVGDAPCRYLPARAPEIISLQALLDLAWDDGGGGTDSPLAGGGISALMRRLNAAQAQALAGLSLKDLMAWQEQDPCAETELYQVH
jgi:hypothetical protein